MPSGKLWAGLDTGFTSCRLCLINEDLDPVLDVELPSTPAALMKALAPFERGCVVEVAAEATSASILPVRTLREAGYRSVLYEVRQVSRYLRLRRNKTDSNDARGLAELAKLQLPSIRAVHLKSPEVQRLRTMLQLRRGLINQRVKCENMLRAQFRVQGLKVPRTQSAKMLKHRVGFALDELRQTSGVDLSREVSPLLRLAVGIRRSIEKLDAQLGKAAKRIKACSSFLSIPGVGPVCAISFYTAIDDPWRFTCAADVGPYLGLTPKVTQSGETLNHGRISKLGSKLTRSHLVSSATVMMQVKKEIPPLQAWAIRLADRAGRPKARVALARRLAVAMLAMWRSGKAYDGELLASKRLT